MLSGPDGVADPDRHRSWNQDYGRTFTSASLREQNRFDGWNARSEAVDTLFFGRWPRKIIGAAVKPCACPGGGDANGTGARRSVALDIGNAVDRRAAHLPCATALARAGSGANRDV